MKKNKILLPIHDMMPNLIAGQKRERDDLSSPFPSFSSNFGMSANCLKQMEMDLDMKAPSDFEIRQSSSNNRPNARSKSPKLEANSNPSSMVVQKPARRKKNTKVNAKMFVSIGEEIAPDSPKSNDNSIHNLISKMDESSDSKKRGRPRKSEPMKESSDVVIMEARAYDSVKKIPCFVIGCGHAYYRPGSSIVERSDRMLALNSKYEGTIIRTCKKHHEIWKRLPQTSNACEICRGLNCEKNDFFQRQEQNNDNGIKFNICDKCCKRQSLVLNIQHFPPIENVGFSNP